jgi:hypothetical protein
VDSRRGSRNIEHIGWVTAEFVIGYHHQLWNIATRSI